MQVKIDKETLEKLVHYVTLYGLLHPDIKTEEYEEVLATAEKSLKE